MQYTSALLVAAIVLAAGSVNADKYKAPPSGSGSYTGNGNVPVEHGYVPDVIQQALNHLNNYRASKGLAPVCLNQALLKSAQIESNHIAQIGQLEHSNDSLYPSQGYPTNTWTGENIAVNMPGNEKSGCTGAQDSISVSDVSSSAAYVTNCQWFQSPGHRENMERPQYNQVGIAYTVGDYMGHQSFYWTQAFGYSTEPCVSNQAPKAPEQPQPPKAPEQPYQPAPQPQPTPAPKPHHKPQQPYPNQPYQPAPAPKPAPPAPKPYPSQPTTPEQPKAPEQPAPYTGNTPSTPPPSDKNNQPTPYPSTPATPPPADKHKNKKCKKWIKGGKKTGGY
ncbi:hypothetical protein RI367_007379 [Sorochytrium milnesiophthora]